MTLVQIRAALEQHLAAMSPTLPTAFENEDFTAPMDAPYQRAHVLFAAPNNDEYGSNHQELGVLIVRLLYPAEDGWGAATARADMLRAHFSRGTPIDGVVIHRTPEVVPGDIDDGRYSLPVRIPFYANISA